MSSESTLWYKDAIIYELHIKAFFDSNNDGIGDFAGLTAKLDYLKELGVTAIWLLPFYPSPLRDDGYDIADYRDVNPSYGTMSDFRRFVKEAHKRDLKVITELVINHTSDQHPWFQRARRAKPGSSHRDFYVWSDTDQKFQDTRIIFLDTESSNWAWDPVAQAYYWHRFYSHQPDLNFDNPAVVREVMNVMRYWLDMGVDGLRLDAVPYLLEREGTNNENLPETHEILKKLRAEIDANYNDRMLIAEANQWPEDVLPYFGDGDECHMAFHFPLMPRIYMAVAQEDRHPITDIMRQTPEIPDNAQWAIFLRNHDELTLEMVTDRERDYLWDFYASDRRMRINLGIRRRLAPLMQNDRRRIDLLNSLLLSMPGTPVLYYGDEIGMGDNVYLGDRDGVRTPMQWSPDRNGGFSRSDPARLYLPAIQDPVYGYQATNVEAQSASPTSLLNSMRRLIAVRRDLQSFGRGKLTFLYPTNRRVLAYIRSYEDETILCVVNLAKAAQSVELDLSAYRGRVPIELLGLTSFPVIGDRSYSITMQGHSFFWFALREPAQSEGGLGLASEHRDVAPEFVTLVVRQGWTDLLEAKRETELTRSVLPSYLPQQRWFGAKDRKIGKVTLAGSAALDDGKEARSGGWRLTIADVELTGAPAQRYLLPLRFVWGPPTDEARAAGLPFTLATVRRFRDEGALLDASTQGDLAAAVVHAIGENRDLPFSTGGKVEFRATSVFADKPVPKEIVTRPLSVEQSNSSVAIQDYGILKLYRRLQPGIHPEVEMSRFLTEVARFDGIPSLLGTVEHIGDKGEPTAMGVLSAFVYNQGDAWTYVQAYLKRSIDATRAGGVVTDPEMDPHRFFLEQAALLGRRTAELHRALCPVEPVDAAFQPEPITSADLTQWRDEVRGSADEVLAALEERLAQAPALDAPVVEAARRLLGLKTALLAKIDAFSTAPIEAMKTRYHGDYHLGQVLVAQNDFVIIDFEGEPKRSIEERRRKHTALKDIAGMIRSIAYAAAAATQISGDLPGVDREALMPLFRDWQQRSTAAFLSNYRSGIAGSAVWPDDEARAQALLELLVIDKALYELGYELANRPAWLAIPISGIVELIEKQ